MEKPKRIRKIKPKPINTVINPHISCFAFPLLFIAWDY